MSTLIRDAEQLERTCRTADEYATRYADHALQAAKDSHSGDAKMHAQNASTWALSAAGWAEQAADSAAEAAQRFPDWGYSKEAARFARYARASAAAAAKSAAECWTAYAAELSS